MADHAPSPTRSRSSTTSPAAGRTHKSNAAKHSAHVPVYVLPFLRVGTHTWLFSREESKVPPNENFWKATLTSKGEVTYTYDSNMKARCELKSRWFPFDKQRCHLVVGEKNDEVRARPGGFGATKLQIALKTRPGCGPLDLLTQSLDQNLDSVPFARLGWETWSSSGTNPCKRVEGLISQMLTRNSMLTTCCTCNTAQRSAAILRGVLDPKCCWVGFSLPGSAGGWPRTGSKSSRFSLQLGLYTESPPMNQGLIHVAGDWKLEEEWTQITGSDPLKLASG